jgi:PAS domain S-box-containing protein
MSKTPAARREADVSLRRTRDPLGELVENEGRLRAVIMATGAAVVCTDEDLQITEFNPAAERAFSRDRAAVVGRRYSELFPAIVRRKVDRDLERVLRGRSIQLFENVLIDAAGKTTIMLWDLQRLIDADGRPSGIVAVGQDITARHPMQENRRGRS